MIAILRKAFSRLHRAICLATRASASSTEEIISQENYDLKPKTLFTNESGTCWIFTGTRVPAGRVRERGGYLPRNVRPARARNDCQYRNHQLQLDSFQCERFINCLEQ